MVDFFGLNSSELYLSSLPMEIYSSCSSTLVLINFIAVPFETIRLIENVVFIWNSLKWTSDLKYRFSALASTSLSANASFIDFSITLTRFFSSSFHFHWGSFKASIVFYRPYSSRKDTHTHKNTWMDLQICCLVSSIDFNKLFPTNLISQQMTPNMCLCCLWIRYCHANWTERKTEIVCR